MPSQNHGAAFLTTPAPGIRAGRFDPEGKQPAGLQEEMLKTPSSLGFDVLILGWREGFWGARQLLHTDLPNLWLLLAAQPHKQHSPMSRHSTSLLINIIQSRQLKQLL